MGFADHACHADPLVCANGCDKERARRFQYILEVRYYGDVYGNLLSGLVSSSDFAPTSQSVVAQGKAQLKGFHPAGDVRAPAAAVGQLIERSPR